MRVVKEPEERRQEILENAIRVFARKGYDKTSISDIAKEMNISQGLCYRYFASKEEIYDVALDMYAEDIVTKHIQEWDASHKTIEQLIETYCGISDDFTKAEQENQELFTVFHNGKSSKKMHDQLALAVGNKLIPYVARILEASKEKGELAITDVNAIAYFIVFGQVGILVDDRIPKDDKNRMICSALLELLKGIKKA